MKNDINLSNPAAHKGVFVFFVLGLFFFQVIFAFTIHGDIGPQTPLFPDIQQATPQVVIGKVDGILKLPQIQQPCRPKPEGVMAPASKTITDTQKSAKNQTNAPAKPDLRNLTDEGDRYLSYKVLPGDNLAKISRKICGNNTLVSPLVRLNRIKDEKSLRCGQIIQIPRLYHKN